MKTSFPRALAIIALASSCVNVARSRAETDETIGQADTVAMRVEVEDGLACIRNIADGELDLRAQAPLVRVRVTLKTAAPSLRVRIRNVLTDVTLEVREVATGAALGVSEEPVAVGADGRVDPSDRAWRIHFGPGGSRPIELRLRAPDESNEALYRFAVLADVQEALPSVLDIYARMNEDKSIRFVVFSGDLTRRGSREEVEEFEDRERHLDVPLFATLGNHELGAEDVPFQKIIGRANLHFQFRKVAFSLLDSASATIDPAVYAWLDTWLEGARDRVHVVAMHIPPLDPAGARNGAFANKSESAKLLALLARGKVDLTLYGHVHSFYAFSNAGIPAYISGGGGAIPERMDGIGRHYLNVDVHPREGIKSVGVTRID